MSVRQLGALGLVALLLAAPAAVAELPPELRSASPLLRTFGPDAYQAHGQNWGFHQLEDGRMLVANNRGVLIYDGTRFERVIPFDGLRVDGIVRSRSGRILISAEGQLGQLHPTPEGGFEYVTLLGPDTVGAEQRLDVAVWNERVWLVNDQSLFRLNGDQARVVVRLDTGRIRRLVVMADQLFMFHSELGLLRVSDRGAEPVLDHPVVFGDGRITIQGLDRSQYMMLNGAGEGLMLSVDSDTLTARPLAEVDQWQQALSLLADQRVYAIRQLSDRRIAVGTIRAGVFIFSAYGELELRIDASNGLPVDTVLGLAEDREGGLWIATVAGIVRAAVHQGVRRLDDRHNLRAMVQHAHRHDDELWIATSVGVMRFDERRFEPVSGILAQSWRIGSLSGIDEPNGVLISHDDGLSWWHQGHLEVLLSREGGFTLQQVDRGHWLMGSRRELTHVCWDGRAWQHAAIPGMDTAIRSLAVDDQGVVWAGSLVEAAFRISGVMSGCPFEKDALEVRRLGREQGLPDSNYAEVYRLGGQIRVGTRFGLYRPDADGRRLLPDTDFETRFHDGNVGWFVTAEDQEGRIFAQLLTGDRRWTEVFVPDGRGRYQSLDMGLEHLPWSRSEGYVVDGDGVWMFGARQMNHIDLTRFQSQTDPGFVPLIRAYGDGGMTGLDLSGKTLSRERSSLSFQFGWPRFDFAENRAWRSRLMGFDADWSDWSVAAFRDYTNLPGGDYRLEVQARDDLGRLSPVAELNFAVARAWYLTVPAMLVWSMLAAATLLLAGRLGRATLKARNRQLEQLVAERTEELRLQRDRMATMAYQDALTGLPNRRDMYRRLATELERSRARGQAMTLMAIDLNDFKLINDRFGHAAGDRTLQRVAEIIVEQVRPDDIVFRLGGDEFVVLCPGLDAKAAAQRAREVAAAVAQEQMSDIASGLAVSISIGVASVTTPKTWEEVLEQADQALYRAKRTNGTL
jgi:diguanylate cyclase (GGDEF)-like protein